MLNNDFDPYQVLIDLANNQTRITDYQRDLAQRLTEQQLIIDQLIEAVTANSNTTNMLVETMLTQLKDELNGKA